MSKLPPVYPDAFIDYLSTFLSEERRQTFARVLSARTRYVSFLAEYIYDTQNLHAMIRTAECLGLQEVHVIEQAAKMKPAKQVSKGSHKWVELIRHRSGEASNVEVFRELKARGYRLAAASPEADGIIPEELPLDKPLMIMFGEEREGLTREAEAHADLHIRIPMYGFTESFNISVAAALCMYPVVQRLHQSDINWHLAEADRHELWRQWVVKTVRAPQLHYKRWLNDKGASDKLSAVG